MPDGSTGCRSSRLDSGRPINRRVIRSTGGGIVMGLSMSHVRRRIGSKRSWACPSRPRLATASEHLLLDAHTDTQTTSMSSSRPRLTARSGKCWPAGTRPHGNSGSAWRAKRSRDNSHAELERVTRRRSQDVSDPPNRRLATLRDNTRGRSRPGCCPGTEIAGGTKRRPIARENCRAATLNIKSACE